jgi:hypothetical protein
MNKINIENLISHTNYITQFKIDSLRILIPVELTKSINIRNSLVIYEDGEIIKQMKKKSGTIEIQPDPKINHTASVYFHVHSWQIARMKEPKSYFVLLMSSKLAGKNYIRYGLRFQDVVNVLKKLADLKIMELIEYSEDIYAKILIKDLDICIDSQIRKNDVKSTLKKFSNLTQINRTNLITRGIKLTDNKNAQMLQINRRENATYANPFLKIYNKNLEMIYKESRGETIFSCYGAEFLKQFDTSKIMFTPFENIDNPEFEISVKNAYKVPEFSELSILRFEYTLRNKEDFDLYEIKNNILSIFDYNNSTWNRIFKSILQKLFTHNEVIFNDEKLVKDIANLTPNDAVLLACLMKIKNLSNRNLIDFRYADLSHLVENLSSPVAKTRQRRRLERLYFILEK